MIFGVESVEAQKLDQSKERKEGKEGEQGKMVSSEFHLFKKYEGRSSGMSQLAVSIHNADGSAGLTFLKIWAWAAAVASVLRFLEAER